MSKQWRNSFRNAEGLEQRFPTGYMCDPKAANGMWKAAASDI